MKALGADVLPYLPTLINALLRDSQISELLDVLPFIGLIAHKFKVTSSFVKVFMECDRQINCLYGLLTSLPCLLANDLQYYKRFDVATRRKGVYLS